MLLQVVRWCGGAGGPVQGGIHILALGRSSAAHGGSQPTSQFECWVTTSGSTSSDPNTRGRYNTVQPLSRASPPALLRPTSPALWHNLGSLGKDLTEALQASGPGDGRTFDSDTVIVAAVQLLGPPQAITSFGRTGKGGIKQLYATLLATCTS